MRYLIVVGAVMAAALVWHRYDVVVLCGRDPHGGPCLRAEAHPVLVYLGGVIAFLPIPLLLTWGCDERPKGTTERRIVLILSALISGAFVWTFVSEVAEPSQLKNQVKDRKGPFVDGSIPTTRAKATSSTDPRSAQKTSGAELWLVDAGQRSRVGAMASRAECELLSGELTALYRRDGGHASFLCLEPALPLGAR